MTQIQKPKMALHRHHICWYHCGTDKKNHFTFITITYGLNQENKPKQTRLLMNQRF